MAKNLKGITIEIGGDTAPLSKALEGVNKNTRSLQVELRQVERLLKLDPTSTELLAQKQELLGQSINSTEEKLNALKAAQIQVQAQFEKGDIGEEQYREFQRELIKTEQELNNLKGAYQVATRNLEEFGDNNGVAKDEAEKLAKAIEEDNRALAEEKEALKRAAQEQKEHEEAVKKATEEIEKQKQELVESAKIIGAGVVAVGAATATGAGYAIKLSDEFDKAFNTLITRTGASKDEFDSLNTSMENIYKNGLGESIEDVAISMATVKTNTNLAGEELEKTTERALILRDTFEFDINESTRSVQMMMKQFGLTSEEAFNLMAQGAQMGLDKNGDLLDTINEYSVHFAQAGYSAEEMFNSLKNGVDAGTFSVDKLGDAVKEFGIRMKDGTADEALKSIGLNVDDVTKRFAQGGETASIAMGDIVEALFSVTDPLKQNTAGVTLFGTMWEDLGAEGVNALMNIRGEADKTSNTLETINNQKYDNIGHALEELGRTMKVDVIKPLGEELQPAVEEAIKYVKDNGPTIKDTLSQIADILGDFISFIVQNGPTIAGIVSGLATSFMVLKGVLVADKVLKFVKSMQTLEGGFKLANLAAVLFNGTLLANPMVWIAAAIAGVVAGLIIFWNTNEDFRNAVIKAWEAIKQSASDCWESICNFFTVTIPEAWKSVETLFSNVGQWFSDIWSNVKETTSVIWNNIINYFKELPSKISNTISDLKEKIINKWDEIKTSAELKVQEIVQNTINFFKELPYNIGFALGSVLGTITSWGINTYNYFTTNVPLWIESISKWFSELPGKISTWLTNTINNIITWGTNVKNKAVEVGTQFVNNIVNFFSQLPGKIATWLTNAINNIITWGTNVKNKAVEVGTQFINNIVNFFSQLPGKIATWLTNTISKVTSFATDMGTKAKQAATQFTNNLVNGVKAIPAKMKTAGKSIVEGIWSGITGSATWINNKIKEFCGGIVDGFKKSLKINSPSKIMRDKIGVGIVEGIDVGIDKEMPVLNKDIKSNMDDMLYNMRNIIDTETPGISLATINGPSNIDSKTNNLFNIDYEKISSAFIEAIQKTNLNNPIIAVDGRELTRSIAPHQSEFDNYRMRKPQTSY